MPFGKVVGTETCSKFPGGFEVVCNLDVTIGGTPYREMAIFGYDSEEKAYTWYDIDSTGFNGLAPGPLQGNTWTFLWEMKVGGKSLKFRTSLVEQPPTWVNQGEFSLDGGPWVLLADVKGTKIK